jgi:hypothetical protein
MRQLSQATVERTPVQQRRSIEAARTESQPAPGAAAAILRTLGALSLLAVGAVHLEEYFAVHINVVPVIGPLFALNFAGATLMGLSLLLPLERLFARGGVVAATLALGAIGLAATSFVFLFVSEQRPLFGFMEHGYRPAIIVALAAEAATTVLLGGYLAALLRRR